MRALFGLIAMLALTAPAFAKDIPDADKWHVGESASSNGIYCPDVESASKALTLRIIAEPKGVPFPAFVQMVRTLGCQMARNLTVKFEGIADAVPQVGPDGANYVIGEFSAGGSVAYTWLPTWAISDQPLVEAPPAIPQMWRFGGTGEYLLPIGF